MYFLKQQITSVCDSRRRINHSWVQIESFPHPLAVFNLIHRPLPKKNNCCLATLVIHGPEITDITITVDQMECQLCSEKMNSEIKTSSMHGKEKKKWEGKNRFPRLVVSLSTCCPCSEILIFAIDVLLEFFPLDRTTQGFDLRLSSEWFIQCPC